MSNKRRIVLSTRNKWLYGRLLFVFDASALAPGAIRVSAAMQEAYEAGKNL